MNKKFPGVGVVALLFNPEDQLLMGKRISIYQGGKFAVPGGKAEFGESLVDAVIREVYEETHLAVVDVKPTGLISNVYYKGEQNHFLTVWFSAFIIPPRLNWDWKVNFVEKDIYGVPKNEGWIWNSYDDPPSPLMPDTMKAWDHYRNRQSIVISEVIVRD